MPQSSKTRYFFAEPGARLGREEIGQSGIARPHADDEGLSVLILAEIPPFAPLFVHGIPVLRLDGGVDDGDQADTARLHLPHEGGKIGKALAVDRKVLVILHVIDIQNDHIDGKTAFPVLVGDLADVRLVHVSPAGLREAEGEFGRDIAAPDHLAEGADHVEDALPFDDVQPEIPAAENRHFAARRIVDVVHDLAGAVDKHAEFLLAVHDEKIVRSVQALPVLVDFRIVHVPARIYPAPLVDAAHLLAQPVHPVLFGEGIAENFARLVLGAQQIGRFPGGYGDIRDDGIRPERMSEKIFMDVLSFLCHCFVIPFDCSSRIPY